MSDTRIYRFDLEPISLNGVYQTSFHSGRRFLSEAGRRYKEALLAGMVEADKDRGKLQAEYLEVSFVFLLPRVRPRSSGMAFFFKNGNPRKLDVSNFIKLLEDSLAEHLEIDDNRNISIHGHKRVHPYDKSEIVVCVSPASLYSEVGHLGVCVC